MTTQLTLAEMGQESALDRDQETEVTVRFKISKEAMSRLVPRGVTRRQFEEAFTTLLACGLYTRIQSMRDAQHVIEPTTHDTGGNVIVPAQRYRDDLRDAGRYGQLALTELESVMTWADKASLRLS